MKFVLALICVLVCCQVHNKISSTNLSNNSFIFFVQSLNAQNGTTPSTVNELFSLLGLINTQQNANNLVWGQQAIAGDRITVLQPTITEQLANYQQINRTQQLLYSPLFSLIAQAESELAQLNQELAAQNSSTTTSSQATEVKKMFL